MISAIGCDSGTFREFIKTRNNGAITGNRADRATLKVYKILETMVKGGKFYLVRADFTGAYD